MAKPDFKRARDQYMYEIGMTDFEENSVNYGNPILKTTSDHEFYKLGVEEAKKRKQISQRKPEPPKTVDIKPENDKKPVNFGSGQDKKW